VFRAGEYGHVGAGLGDDDLGGPSSLAGDGADQVTERTKRGHRLIDPLVELIDLTGALVDGLQEDAGQEGVVLGETAGEGFGQLGDLGPQPTLG